MRKLASIQKIINIESIKGANQIEVASVLGWKVVIKKGEFKIGDKCVYCEIDSVMPKENSDFEFLRKNNFRIKTIKLRGQISQGICFPLSIVHHILKQPNEGIDVTKLLNIKKYNLPEKGSFTGGESSGSFPFYLIPKTDEVRIQAIPEILNEIKGKMGYITVKLDGTSGTFLHWENKVFVCSRKRKVKGDTTNVYWKMYRKYNLKEVLEKEKLFALQGEICGPGIQGNKLGLKKHDLYIFNIWNLKTRKYINFKELLEFCKKHNLKHVPIFKESIQILWDLKDFLEMAKGTYKESGKQREGVVVRPMIETYSEILKGRLSFKVINNDFLLGENNDT